MDFWAQFWSTMWGALAGALVAGGATALIAWRTFVHERAARERDRAAAARAAAAAHRRRHYERVLRLLAEMFQMVSTSREIEKARALNVKFSLAVTQMTAGEPKLDRDRFAYWAMNIGEEFLALVTWEADEWRMRADEFRPWIEIANRQLELWLAGEEGTEGLILDHDAAASKYLPDWTTQSIGLR